MMPEQGDDSSSVSQPSRRWFNQALLVGAAAVAMPGVGLALQPGGSFAPFDISYRDDVLVQVTGGERFTVSVVSRKDRTELERHDGVTGASIHRLRSPYFEVSRLRAPSAA